MTTFKQQMARWTIALDSIRKRLWGDSPFHIWSALRSQKWLLLLLRQWLVLSLSSETRC